MSYDAERWARSQKVGNASAKFVLIELANALNRDDKDCYPSVEALEVATELNRKTIMAATKFLEERGFIKKRRTFENGKQRIYYSFPSFIPSDWAMKQSTKNGTLEDTKNGTLAIVSTENGTTESTDIGTLESTKNGTVTRNKNKEIEQGIDISVEEKPKRATQKGTRLTIDVLPDDWRKYCEEHAPDLDPEKAFEDFHDYWVGVPGAKGVKLDWFATWRNFLRGIPDWKRKNFVKSTKPTGRLDTTSAEYLEIYRRGCTYDPNAEPSPADADGFVAF